MAYGTFCQIEFHPNVFSNMYLIHPQYLSSFAITSQLIICRRRRRASQFGPR